MAKKVPRTFSREFKLKAIERLEAGESGTDLSRELTVKREILYRWRDAFRAGGALALRSKPGRVPKAEAVALAQARGPAAKARHLAEARRQIAALERKVGQQQVEIDFFRQALQHIETSRGDERSTRRDGVYAFIQARTQPQGELSVERMCALAGVTRAGYYRHLRLCAARGRDLVRDHVQRLALANRHKRPPADRGIAEARGLGGQQEAGPQADAAGQPAVPAPARLRAGDDRLAPCVAHLAESRLATRAHGAEPALGCRHHLCAPCRGVRLPRDSARRVQPARDRWAMASHLRASLALGALEMALSHRAVPPAGGLVHHSDRGVQYACADYIARLQARGIQPSMSRIACPYDKPWPRLHETLKVEEVDGRAYRDLAQARVAIGSFIEDVYNRQRLHSALRYRPPVEFEASQPCQGLLRSSP